MRPLACALLAMMLFTVFGCPPSEQGSGIQHAVSSNEILARERYNDGVRLMDKGDFNGALKEFDAAIRIDPTCGPAYNNRGLIYFRQKKLYKALQDFGDAAKLMPDQVEPRYNQGLVLEMEPINKFEEAARMYEEAMEIDHGAVEVTSNLARVYVRMNRNDERTRQLLNDIVLKDDRPEWKTWARERLVVLGTSQPASAPTTMED